MATWSRLQKLENVAASLLSPDGAALNQRCGLLPEKERQQWFNHRTPEELDAMIRANGGEPLDMKQFTEAEREQMRAMSDEELCRILKGDFSQLRQAPEGQRLLPKDVNSPIADTGV
jgi:hypothetical protein